MKGPGWNRPVPVGVPAQLLGDAVVPDPVASLQGTALLLLPDIIIVCGCSDSVLTCPLPVRLRCSRVDHLSGEAAAGMRSMDVARLGWLARRSHDSLGMCCLRLARCSGRSTLVFTAEIARLAKLTLQVAAGMRLGGRGGGRR